MPSFSAKRSTIQSVTSKKSELEAKLFRLYLEIKGLPEALRAEFIVLENAIALQVGDCHHQSGCVLPFSKTENAVEQTI